jgi:TRAP-type C4-dicarboxylate transport system substrate-binding protein
MRWGAGLSGTVQHILMKAAEKARDAEREDTRREASQALATLKERGMQINEVSADEIQRMRERAQPAIQTVIDAVGQELFDQVQAEVEKASQ